MNNLYYLNVTAFERTFLPPVFPVFSYPTLWGKKYFGNWITSLLRRSFGFLLFPLPDFLSTLFTLVLVLESDLYWPCQPSPLSFDFYVDLAMENTSRRWEMEKRLSSGYFPYPICHDLAAHLPVPVRHWCQQHPLCWFHYLLISHAFLTYRW